MQLTDKDGNVFGTGGLEITTSSGKPKVPVINTDITIGTTVIVGGVAGRLLFDDAGVVGETNGVHWDKVNGRLGLGTTTPTQTLDVQGDISMGVSGATTVRTFYNSTTRNQLIYTNNSSLEFFQSINERMRLAPGSGNLLLNTTTDAGFKLDVNGTVRVRGVGTTNATTAFTVTNSAAAYNSLIIRDDGTFVFGNPNNGVAYLTAASNGNITATYFNAGLDLGAGRKVTSVQYFSSGSITASSALAQGVAFNNTLVAAANNDVLVGLDIAPTFTNGAFTGVSNFAARFGSDVTFTARNSSISVQRPSTQANGFSLTISAGGATTQGTGGSLFLLAGSGTGGPGSGQVVIGNDTSTYNNIILRGYTYVTSTGPNQGTAFAVFAGGQTGISIYWDNPAAFMQYGLVSGRQARFVNSSSYTFSSKVFIGTNTDAGYNFDVNGTARINNIFYVTNPSYTGNIRIEAIANTQQRIVGANGENITWGPDNAIRINSGETYVSGSFLGSGWWMQSNGATVLGAQAAAAASALLDIRSTTRGFLPPRMTNAQMLAISTPATGLMVYDTTNNKLCCYDGTTWQNLF